MCPPPQMHRDSTSDSALESTAQSQLTQDQLNLIERARQLSATAVELEAALDTLAQQAEAVLHRLRGGRLQ